MRAIYLPADNYPFSIDLLSRFGLDAKCQRRKWMVLIIIQSMRADMNHFSNIGWVYKEQNSWYAWSTVNSITIFLVKYNLKHCVFYSVIRKLIIDSHPEWAALTNVNIFMISTEKDTIGSKDCHITDGKSHKIKKSMIIQIFYQDLWNLLLV